MSDIKSPTADIRRGKKNKQQDEKLKIYMACPITQGGHKLYYFNNNSISEICKSVRDSHKTCNSAQYLSITCIFLLNNSPTSEYSTTLASLFILADCQAAVMVVDSRVSYAVLPLWLITWNRSSVISSSQYTATNVVKFTEMAQKMDYSGSLCEKNHLSVM